MANYIVTEDELTYEAQRIRAKTGDDQLINYVAGRGFGDAIDAIVCADGVIQHYYTGTSEPSSSIGINGDIYLMTGA